MQSLVLFCYNYLISVTNIKKITFNSGNMGTHKEKTKTQQQCFKFVLILTFLVPVGIFGPNRCLSLLEL